MYTRNYVHIQELNSTYKLSIYKPILMAGVRVLVALVQVVHSVKLKALVLGLIQTSGTYKYKISQG